MAKSAKREGPDPVTPVTIDRVRFEALHWGKELGVNQNGGYVAAFDTTTGKRLWTLKVYDIVYDPDRERDVQDVFITRLSVFNGKLRVANEDERQFVVDPKTRSITEL